MTTPADNPVQPDIDAEDVSPHIVRLVMTVQARDQVEAVLMMVEELTAKGLRNWVYSTLDLEGRDTGDFNGYGEDVSESLARIRAAETGEDEAPDPQEQATPAEPKSEDAELLALAEQLNGE
jgi:hypothetical protein